MERLFEAVEYVDAGIAGELGFTTAELSEADFAARAAGLETVNYIRLG